MINVHLNQLVNNDLGAAIFMEFAQCVRVTTNFDQLTPRWGRDTLGFMQKGDLNFLSPNSKGFLRGFVAGAIPQDLFFDKAYLESGAANIAIGIARDGLRGGIVGGRDGILRGIAIGQSTNAIGHIVGAATGTFNRFENGAFIYEQSASIAGNNVQGLTLGNVISFGNLGSTNAGEVLRHEYAHVEQRFLGALYMPAHALNMTVSGIIGMIRGEGFHAGTHNKFSILECSPIFISLPAPGQCR